MKNEQIKGDLENNEVLFFNFYDPQTMRIVRSGHYLVGTQPEYWTLAANNDSYYRSTYDPLTGTIYDGATIEDIQGYEWEADVKHESAKYLKRTQDGIEAYAKISAEFRLAKLNGIISEEAHGVIEDMLIPVRNEVLAGQWISGLQKLQAIGSGVIGGVLYNRLLNQIQAYIDENY